MEEADEKWRHQLTPEQFHILREKGTEVPFSGALLENRAAGAYACAACGSIIFKSEAKYDSNTPGLAGWPSFSEAASNTIDFVEDNSAGMRRTEVVCKTCDSHLGHIFDDPGSPSGKHYCINSVALQFRPEK
ncbi:MAG TPA: peptide-methionine (R)-S-oxide reductase MsrB [Candidatus Saccharimonadales bacterium]|nr:peptide-methionine (R)-S-oxide reductase MsrB [Candidatus Saccharimonadales bacterium]